MQLLTMIRLLLLPAVLFGQCKAFAFSPHVFAPWTPTAQPFAPWTPATVETIARQQELSPTDKFRDAMATSGEKYFQLEEKEDAEFCTTEICVKADHTILVGETNGPRFVSAIGSWQAVRSDDDNLREDNEMMELELKVSRTYEAGHETSGNHFRSQTNLGKFTFAVERRYLGTFSFVGEQINLEGSIHDVDIITGMDKVVGYFSMIDVTQERERMIMSQQQPQQLHA